MQRHSKPINPMSTCRDWAWNPEAKDIPELKHAQGGKKKKRRSNRDKRKKVSRLENKEFYCSEEWRELRVRVLEKYECKCMMCGRSPKKHGIAVHVDHIKPRSKYPNLSLVFENLQILCEDCNIGKGNKYQTDYRPRMRNGKPVYVQNIEQSEDEINKELDRILLSELGQA